MQKGISQKVKTGANQPNAKYDVQIVTAEKLLNAGSGGGLGKVETVLSAIK